MIETHRLILRQWRDADLPAFSALNADPNVMRYFPNLLSTMQSNQLAHRCRDFIAENGWGLWAVETKAEREFIGFVGLSKPSYPLPFSPCVEIGWRLSQQHWGKGYATEAAKQVLVFAFNSLSLDEIVSFTSVQNVPSQAVMRRIGMVNVQHNFAHPKVDEGHVLEEHVLFKITKKDWQNYTAKINTP